MNKTTLIWIIVFVAIIAVLAVLGAKQSKKPGPYDAFAQCISDSGAQFYGAFWCPHCADQKKKFGTSAKFLPYVECSTPDGKGQTQLCIEKQIESYPTWIYPNGFSLASAVEPEMCDVVGTPNLSPNCQRAASASQKTWIFGSFVARSDTAPTIVDSIYTFGPNTRTGETELERFAEITNCALPAEV